ncbi:MAG: AAA family ATPase [Sandaracinobacter sp.]
MASLPETQETVVELRERLNRLYEDTGMSWAEIAAESGIKAGTLTQWAKGTYAGDNLRYAAEVRRYLDGRAALAALQTGTVEDPGFLETLTADRILGLLQWAQTGKIVAVAAGPGTGKTMAAREYRTRSANVWLATMKPSSSGVQPMQMTVLAAMGDVDGKGSPQQLSARILAKVRGTRGLIIVDEAQELSEKALDELRSWHDECGIGIALLGDERVIGRLGGLRRAELARLHSRVSMRHIQKGPTEQDAAMVARGWGISDEAMLRFLKQLAEKPGGLRGISMVIELGSLLAAREERSPSLSDLREAWAQLNSELMGA